MNFFVANYVKADLWNNLGGAGSGGGGGGGGKERYFEFWLNLNLGNLVIR